MTPARKLEKLACLWGSWCRDRPLQDGHGASRRARCPRPIFTLAAPYLANTHAHTHTLSLSLCNNKGCLFLPTYCMPAAGARRAGVLRAWAAQNIYCAPRSCWARHDLALHARATPKRRLGPVCNRPLRGVMCNGVKLKGRTTCMVCSPLPSSSGVGGSFDMGAGRRFLRWLTKSGARRRWHALLPSFYQRVMCVLVLTDGVRRSNQTGLKRQPCADRD